MSKINLTPQPIFAAMQNLLDKSNPTWITWPKDIPNYQSDYEFAKDFLTSYRGSQATFNAYRRDIERLLQWCWLIAKKSLPSLTREDIENLIAFYQSPPKNWLGYKNVARFVQKNGIQRPNPEWRPFVFIPNDDNQKRYALSQKSLQATFAVFNSFFSFLVQNNYINTNPVLQIRQKSKYFRSYQIKHKIRRLSELQWTYVIETANIMASQNPKLHERTLFIVSMLYGMYLRISELTANANWTPTMNDFSRDADGNWWFKTVGKGNKERDISVSDSMLEALKRYRRFLGLSSLPTPSDNNPLILNNRTNTPIKSTRQIRRIVEDCFQQAQLRLIQDGFTDEAEQLKEATVHWLRHTGISEDVKYRPREHVRDDAGHSSSAITDKYIDVELRERHQSAKKKVINPDD